MTGRKKSVVVTYPFFNKQGGVERVMVEMMRYMSFDKRNYYIAATEVEKDYKPADLLEIHVPSLKKPFFLSAFTFCLGNLLRSTASKGLIHAFGATHFSPDIVHAHSCHKAWFLQSIREVPFLSKAWLLKLLNPVHYFTIVIETIQYKFSRVQKVIAASKIVKDDVVRCFGVPEEKVSVVYNAVNSEEFHPKHKNSKEQVRSSLGLSSEDYVLIFVANEFKRKRLTTIVEALHKQSSSVKLLVVGKDNPAPFQAQIQEYGLEDRIQFLGLRSDLSELYGASDLFLLPTSHDAFALVVTEAMAAGLPVITTPMAGASEVIQNDQNGFILSDPDDSEELFRLIELIKNHKNIESIEHEARNTAERMSWQNFSSQVEEIYDELESANQKR